MSDLEGPVTPAPKLPLAVPVGFSSGSAKAQATTASDGLRETNTPSTTSSVVIPGRRVGRRRLEQLATSLANRDETILRAINEHRYLTGHQLQSLFFRDHASEESGARTCRRVLARLQRYGLIRALARRIGGVRAGSSSTVWQLASAGARLLRADGSMQRIHEPSLRFLRHCLAVADVRIELDRLVWDGLAEEVRIDIEPECWRRYTGPGGEPRWLQPDMFARILTRKYDDRWFIEVDLGTESLPTLLRKCAAYETYRATGQEQSGAGVFPLVLWVFDRPDRADRLQHALSRSRQLTPELYRMTVMGEVAQVVTGVPS